MKRWIVMLASLAFLVAVQPAEEVEAQVTFGPQVVLFDFEELGIGARVDFGLADAFGIEEGFFEGLFGSVNVSYLFMDGDATPLDINANANVTFDVDGGIRPYAGAGINHLRISFQGFSVSNSGLNLLGGLFFDLGDLPAFGELKYSTTGAGFITLGGGIMFGG